MKYEAHIPTEMYGYLGFSDFEGTVEEAWAKYHEIKETVRVKPEGEGLSPQEWRKLLSAYMHGKPYDYDGVREKLNKEQYFCLNEIKKSRTRGKEKSVEMDEVDDGMPGPGKGENGDYSGMD